MKLWCSTGIVLFAIAGGFSPRAEGADHPPHTQFNCSRDIVRTEIVNDLPAGLTRRADRPAGGLQRTEIVLRPGPGLLKIPEALAAFERAAQAWEAFFYEPVTVVIDADLAELGPNVLGQNVSRRFNIDYTEIRDAMVADGQVPEPVVQFLPTLSAYDVILPEGFNLVSELRAAKANLRALGFDMSFDNGNSDATIRFATGFLNLFDFDRTNGVSSLLFAFEGICRGPGICTASPLDRHQRPPRVIPRHQIGRGHEH